MGVLLVPIADLPVVVTAEAVREVVTAEVARAVAREADG